MVIAPSPFTEPPMTSAPSPFSTGFDSPVRHRLVEARYASHDDRIGRHALTRFDQHLVARGKRIDRHVLRRSVRPEPVRLRGQQRTSDSSAPEAPITERISISGRQQSHRSASRAPSKSLRRQART